MASPLGPFEYVGLYEININGRPYPFRTLFSKNGIVAWMPDTEQQHVNPQYRGGLDHQPVWISGVNKWDVVRIFQQILLFQTKNNTPLEDIVDSYGQLTENVLKDFQSYQLATPTKPS